MVFCYVFIKLDLKKKKNTYRVLKKNTYRVKKNISIELQHFSYRDLFAIYSFSFSVRDLCANYFSFKVIELGTSVVSS